jgi:hypothetical protein
MAALFCVSMRLVLRQIICCTCEEKANAEALRTLSSAEKFKGARESPRPLHSEGARLPAPGSHF